MTRTLEAAPEGLEPTGEIDLRAIGRALRRHLRLLVTVGLGACVLIAIVVTVIPARYTAQSQVLLENQETFFTRPDRVNVQQVDQASQLDPEAVASQVQLITSRDIAREAIKELGLEGNDEFDPLAGGLSAVRRVLVLLGLARDPTRETRDARIVTAFLDKLVVYSPPKTRVIAIEFTSRDPVLNLSPGDVGHALRQMEQRKLVRSQHGSRAQRWEHRMAEGYSLTALRAAAVRRQAWDRYADRVEALQRAVERIHEFMNDQDFLSEKGPAVSTGSSPPPASPSGSESWSPSSPCS